MLTADTAIIRTLPATPLEPCEKRAARVSSTALVRYLQRDNLDGVRQAKLAGSSRCEFGTGKGYGPGSNRRWMKVQGQVTWSRSNCTIRRVVSLR